MPETLEIPVTQEVIDEAIKFRANPPKRIRGLEDGYTCNCLIALAVYKHTNKRISFTGLGGTFLGSPNYWSADPNTCAFARAFDLDKPKSHFKPFTAILTHHANPQLVEVKLMGS